jgi:hypothetical protein
MFYDVFHSVGFTPSIPQMDKMRESTGRLSKLLEGETKLIAIELIDRVQGHIKEAFTSLGSQVDKQGDLQQTHQKLLQKIQADVDRLKRTAPKGKYVPAVAKRQEQEDGQETV